MILETIGGWYVGMVLGLLTSYILWFAARAKAHRRDRSRRSLPRALTRHIVGEPPDLATMRFPLLTSQFVPHVSPAALYRPASTQNLPARIYGDPNNIAYYEIVPESSADSATLVVTQQRCFIGTLDEHVAAFHARLESAVCELLVTPRAQSVAMPEAHLLLGRDEDSPPVWLDALQRTVLAMHWANLRAVQSAPAYSHYGEVLPEVVSLHPATRRYDELLRTRAAPYQAGEPEGAPGERVDSFRFSRSELGRTMNAFREDRALEDDAAGLRYLVLTDCSSPPAE